MSLRLEMLQVARLAPSVLGIDASSLIGEFIRKKRREDGGFAGRDDGSDLYYTSFAIDALTALSEDLPEASLHDYLSSQLRNFQGLDFVHLCCLARCVSALKSHPFNVADLDKVLNEIELFRSKDGGYNQAKELETGSAYACFLAYGAYSDLRRPLVDGAGIAHCLESLAHPCGAWANDTLFPVPNVPATAAAVTLNRNLGVPVPLKTGHWILGECYQPVSGGILPFPGAPLPDLLSTAVALHALDGMQIDFSDKKEALLNFIDSLWTNEGGFHGSWEDDDLDIEYTYYGLLSLGHLAL